MAAPSRLELIKAYYDSLIGVSQHIAEPPTKSSTVELDKNVKDLQVNDTETSLEDQLIKDFLNIGEPEVSQRQPTEKDQKQI
jgi:hypothetical protein